MSKEQKRFREAIKQGLADAKAGRVMSLDEARRRLRQASAPAGK